MGKLLCEKYLRDVWCRNESVRAEIGQILHTDTRVNLSSNDKEGYDTNGKGGRPEAEAGMGRKKEESTKSGDHEAKWIRRRGKVINVGTYKKPERPPSPPQEGAARLQ